MEIIKVSEIEVGDRLRKDYGDISDLAKSIKEFGIIQPIVLTNYENKISLVAGGRRLTAIKSLGIAELEHGVGFVWNSELQGSFNTSDDFQLKKRSIEMEENLKRKDLSWTEQVLGKQKLLALMQEIHGQPIVGRPSASDKASSSPGFGVNKLAAMLGESNAQTSLDLELAALITKVPSLQKEATREDAKRKLTSEVLKFLVAKKASTTTVDETFGEMFLGSFIDNIQNVKNESVDLVYTDLPYGVNLSDMDKHQSTELAYDDERLVIVSLLESVAKESYRILKPDRFAVFWFGFNYYQELLEALKLYGFEVNPVPFIWLKNSASTQLPLLLYANSYEQALVARKGVPRFIKPGQKNSIQLASESSKIHIAQQPVDLPKKFIEDMVIPGGTIVDLMCGSGTTGVAAIGSGRKCILFEKDEKIFNFAKIRIADAITKLRS